jgi:hypothetical protein
MKFKISGKFVKHTVKEIPNKKEPEKPFRGGDAIFTIINKRIDFNTEEITEYPTDVPFNVFGAKISEVVEGLVYGQECEITFELKGSEYQGKTYGKIQALSIKTQFNSEASTTASGAAPDADIPF